MSETKGKLNLYAVVEVWRGIAADVHVFRRLSDAEQCYHRLLREHNLQEDDVELFETRVQ